MVNKIIQRDPGDLKDSWRLSERPAEPSAFPMAPEGPTRNRTGSEVAATALGTTARQSNGVARLVQTATHQKFRGRLILSLLDSALMVRIHLAAAVSQQTFGSSQNDAR